MGGIGRTAKLRYVAETDDAHCPVRTQMLTSPGSEDQTFRKTSAIGEVVSKRRHTAQRVRSPPARSRRRISVVVDHRNRGTGSLSPSLTTVMATHQDESASGALNAIFRMTSTVGILSNKVARSIQVQPSDVERSYEVNVAQSPASARSDDGLSQAGLGWETVTPKGGGAMDGVGLLKKVYLPTGEGTGVGSERRQTLR